MSNIFVTSKEIIDNLKNLDWEKFTIPANLPDRDYWIGLSEININDVTLWEKIFYKAGLIGVYAAWNPYADFYIVTFNFFPKNKHIIEFYKTETDVIKRLADLNVNIPVNQIRIL